MSGNPNYPEGVTEKDIDRIGEPIMGEEIEETKGGNKMNEPVENIFDEIGYFMEGTWKDKTYIEYQESLKKALCKFASFVVESVIPDCPENSHPEYKRACEDM